MPREGSEAVTEPLPELLDAKRLQAELGVTRAAAEAVMRRLPVVQFPGVRKVYVKRTDVTRLIEESTSPGEWRFEKTGGGGVNGPGTRGEVSPTPSVAPGPRSRVRPVTHAPRRRRR
jgi:hypothetical protein